MASITIQGIAKSFGPVQALAEIDLTVADGEFLALLGPSGCGKTTLLRIVAGLETQSQGCVLIGDRDVSALPPRKRGLAMVFQNYAVFPHLTVFENVAFGLRMAKAEKARVVAQVEKAASLLHIEGLLQRYPAQLSGGQRQRVAVARALAVEPAVLLMDEPLSNLDALLRLEMRAELKAVLAEAGTTTLYVTHDQTEAMGLADRIAVMHGGRIEQFGTPSDIYDRPRTRFVGGFVGSPPMNFLDLPVANGSVDLDGMALAAPPGASDRLLLGLRAEDVALAAEGEACFPFQLKVAELLGPQIQLTGSAAGGQPLRVVLPAGTALPALTPGTTLRLKPDIGRLSWMNSNGIALETRS